MAAQGQRKRIVLAMAGAVVIGMALLPYFLSPLSPQVVRHAPGLPAAETHYVAYQSLETGWPYPEGLVLAPDGSIVLGSETGALLRLTPDADGGHPRVQEITDLGGHSIGLVHDAAARAYWSATYPLGLQRIGEDGSLSTLEDVDGLPLGFPDDVAVDREGIVYVTDASAKYNLRTTRPGAPFVLWDFIEGRANGRLIAYDPATGIARTALDGLAFPSGITLTQDGSALLIVEVTRYRVIRYELTGPDRGSVSVIADRLPGIPDDVFLGTEGEIWVTLVAPRSQAIDGWILRHPYLARLVSILPWSVQNGMLAPAETGGSILQLAPDAPPTCELRTTDGPPPANGLVWGDKILLGRLGGTSLIAIDPQACETRQ